MEDRGVTFPKGDIEALGKALQKLCDEPETVARYQATAADYICEKYNWDDVTEKTLELYR
jgi:glycosyltransferase involved in cell wall biosynthesis